jgi:hypothetical protein
MDTSCMMLHMIWKPIDYLDDSYYIPIPIVVVSFYIVLF